MGLIQALRDRIKATKWDELSGVGKAVFTQRIEQWCDERRDFATWWVEERAKEPSLRGNGARREGEQTSRDVRMVPE
jgi:hypothetical protein